MHILTYRLHLSTNAGDLDDALYVLRDANDAHYDEPEGGDSASNNGGGSGGGGAKAAGRGAFNALDVASNDAYASLHAALSVVSNLLTVPKHAASFVEQAGTT
jgi:hypothetical protein